MTEGSVRNVTVTLCPAMAHRLPLSPVPQPTAELCVRCLSRQDAVSMLRYAATAQTHDTIAIHVDCVRDYRRLQRGVPMVRGTGEPPSHIRPIDGASQTA